MVRMRTCMNSTTRALLACSGNPSTALIHYLPQVLCRGTDRLFMLLQCSGSWVSSAGCSFGALLVPSSTARSSRLGEEMSLVEGVAVGCSSVRGGAFMVAGLGVATIAYDLGVAAKMVGSMVWVGLGQTWRPAAAS